MGQITAVLGTEPSFASGSRRSRAATAVANALNAADFIAIAVVGGDDRPVADAVQRELALQPGHRLLTIPDGDALWLGEPGGPDRTGRRLEPTALLKALSAHGAPVPEVNRAILLWRDVDELILNDRRRFFELVEVIQLSLTQPRTPVWQPNQAHKAILVGRAALISVVEELSSRLEGGPRYRYILVR